MVGYREGGIWLSIRIFHGWETAHLERLQDHKFAGCCDLWGRSGDGKLETSTSGMERGSAGLSVNETALVWMVSWLDSLSFCQRLFCGIIHPNGRSQPVADRPTQIPRHAPIPDPPFFKSPHKPYFIGTRH